MNDNGMICGTIAKNKSIRDFHSLTKVICDTSMISESVENIAKRDIFKLLLNILTHHFGESIPWNSSKFSKFPLNLCKAKMKPIE